MAGRRAGWRGKGRKGGRCREPERAETVRRFVTVTRALTSSGECTREGKGRPGIGFSSTIRGFAPLLLLLLRPPDISFFSCVVSFEEKKKEKKKESRSFLPPLLPSLPFHSRRWCSGVEVSANRCNFLFFFVPKRTLLLERCFSGVGTETFSVTIPPCARGYIVAKKIFCPCVVEKRSGVILTRFGFRV